MGSSLVRLVALSGLLVACSKPEAAPAPNPAPAASSVAAPTTKAATPAFDAPMSKKSGDGVEVMLVEASGFTDKGQPPSAILSFNITNQSDKERAISPSASIQITSNGLPTGEIDRRKSQCTGYAPPKGNIGCILLVSFPGQTEPPAELMVRVDGAWFRVAVTRPDAGR